MKTLRGGCARRPRALLCLAVAALAVACGSGAKRAAAPTAGSLAPNSQTDVIASPAASSATRQPLAARQVSPPQTPADHPLVDAEAPDLPPLAGPLQNVAVTVPAGLKNAPQQQSLNLPAGFSASVYAVTGGGARFMALGPDGAVYVALMGRGQIVRLDSQGSYATPTKILDGLNAPSSLAFFGGYLYVGENNQIARFTFNGAVDPASKQVVVPNLPTGGHATRTIGFGPDGLLYVAVGSSCNVCIESNPLRAAITVYNPDGSNGRTYASGLRNAVGFTWQLDSGDMWATMNGRDDIGQDMGLTGQAAKNATDNLPPDYATRISDGGNYGWPRCYGDHQLDPKYGDAGFCATTIAPTAELQAHSAPLGLAFYTGAQFPADYQGSLFVALHGSWDRENQTGYKVIRLVFENGQPVRAEDFATGWLNGSGVWGRPVGVLVAPDGSLLVSDDSQGVIYRISYGG
jgi:glucose/arabinose dehydrogenase